MNEIYFGSSSQIKNKITRKQQFFDLYPKKIIKNIKEISSKLSMRNSTNLTGIGLGWAGSDRNS